MSKSILVIKTSQILLMLYGAVESIAIAFTMQWWILTFAIAVASGSWYLLYMLLKNITERALVARSERVTS